VRGAWPVCGARLPRRMAPDPHRTKWRARRQSPPPRLAHRPRGAPYCAAAGAKAFSNYGSGHLQKEGAAPRPPPAAASTYPRPGSAATAPPRPVPLSLVVREAVKRWFEDTRNEAERGDLKQQALLAEMLDEVRPPLPPTCAPACATAAAARPGQAWQPSSPQPPTCEGLRGRCEPARQPDVREDAARVCGRSPGSLGRLCPKLRNDAPPPPPGPWPNLPASPRCVVLRDTAAK